MLNKHELGHFDDPYFYLYYQLIHRLVDFARLYDTAPEQDDPISEVSAWYQFVPDHKFTKASQLLPSGDNQRQLKVQIRAQEHANTAQFRLLHMVEDKQQSPRIDQRGVAGYPLRPQGEEMYSFYADLELIMRSFKDLRSDVQVERSMQPYDHDLKWLLEKLINQFTSDVVQFEFLNFIAAAESKDKCRNMYEKLLKFRDELVAFLSVRVDRLQKMPQEWDVKICYDQDGEQDHCFAQISITRQWWEKGVFQTVSFKQNLDNIISGWVPNYPLSEVYGFDPDHGLTIDEEAEAFHEEELKAFWTSYCQAEGITDSEKFYQWLDELVRTSIQQLDDSTTNRLHGGYTSLRLVPTYDFHSVKRSYHAVVEKFDRDADAPYVLKTQLEQLLGLAYSLVG